ncbi:MAG: hypothetical protein L0Y50_01925 [Beijerinckiaceae bacterium]|nr:hypothetical protein [Beijerinckiaceae bacterium]MCI0735028.1 hypothetical protein [Beijerinckiaceae bacterium]
MKTSNIAIWAAPVLAAGSIALSGCGQRSAANPTTISYSQIGLCKTYNTLAGTEEKAKSNEAFAVFKIVTIDNSKPSSVFTFDPARFYVDQSTAAQKTKNLSFQQRRFMNPDPRFAKAMGVASPELISLKGGEKLDVNGVIIVPIATNLPSGGQESDSFDLVYDSTTAHEQTQTSEGLVVAKTNPAGTKYSTIESCKELALK